MTANNHFPWNIASICDGDSLKSGHLPLWSLTQNQEEINDTVPKEMGRLTGKEHGDMRRYGDAFFQDSPEILNNSRWQDVRVSAGK